MTVLDAESQSRREDPGILKILFSLRSPCPLRLCVKGQLR